MRKKHPYYIIRTSLIIPHGNTLKYPCVNFKYKNRDEPRNAEHTHIHSIYIHIKERSHTQTLFLCILKQSLVFIWYIAHDFKYKSASASICDINVASWRNWFYIYANAMLMHVCMCVYVTVFFTQESLDIETREKTSQVSFYSGSHDRWVEFLSVVRRQIAVFWPSI